MVNKHSDGPETRLVVLHCTLDVAGGLQTSLLMSEADNRSEPSVDSGVIIVHFSL